MSLLHSPFTLKNITLKNRIVVSPMSQYSSVDGFANDWHLVHLGSRAVGGAGLVFQEATAVSPEGRISSADAGLWKGAHVDKWKQIVSFVKGQGSLIGVQLAHAGRKASTLAPWKNVAEATDLDKWTTFAPSAIPHHTTDPTPIALDNEGIKKVIHDFQTAAERAIEAGYDAIEIHAAHGYLIHQFLSPLSNTRTDNYGGSFENRVRLLLEIVKAVKLVLKPQTLLFVRISATDWVSGGWSIEDSIQLSTRLKELGVDVIDVSTGGLLTKVSIPVAPGYQVSYAEQIKAAVDIPVGAVGLINSAKQGEEILANGQADLIFMGRELLRNPHFPLLSANTLGDSVQYPVQYFRAKP